MFGGWSTLTDVKTTTTTTKKGVIADMAIGDMVMFSGRRCVFNIFGRGLQCQRLRRDLMVLDTGNLQDRGL